MLSHLVRREILDHLLSSRFVVLAGIASLAIWVSLLDGANYYLDNLHSYQDGRLATEERVNRMKDPPDTILKERFYWGDMFNFGYLEHKPPVVLSIFVRGVDPVLGRSALVRSPPTRGLTRSPDAEQPILAAFPALGLEFVVQTILGLFMLLLTFDAVCGAKEDGTLRLTDSFSVPRRQLLLAKFLGTYVPAISAFGASFLLGLVVVLLIPDVRLSGDEWLRLAWILVSFGLYLAVLTWAGILGSVLTRRPATSFAMLLAFWAVSVVVMPRLSLVVADFVRQTPSRSEHEAKRLAAFWDQYSQDLKDREEWAKAYQDSTGRPYGASPEGMEAFYNYIQEAGRTSGEVVQGIQARMDEDFQNRYNAWFRTGTLVARVSPGFSVTNAAVRLAGTGAGRHRRFLASYDQFMKAHIDWIGRAFNRSQLRRFNPQKYGPYEWDIHDIPRFSYVETYPVQEIESTLVDLGVLVLWGAVFFFLAHTRLTRYDVR